MEITIIKNEQLQVYTLPKNIIGNYWITDFENGKKVNLINVEANDGKWELISNQNFYVIDNNEVMVPSISLNEYSFYLLYDKRTSTKYYLYCSPVVEGNNLELAINNNGIKVGASESCDVTYTLNGLQEEAFSIVKQENQYVLSLTNSEVKLYINRDRVTTQTVIGYGDIIFLFGLKMVLLKKDNVDYFLINNPGNMLSFKANMVKAVPEKNSFVDDKSVLNDDVQMEKEHFYRTPHFYRTITTYEVNIDAPPAKKEEQDKPLLLTIGPMLTMSLMSVMTLLTQVNSVAKGEKDIDQAFTGMISAGVMLASCLLWPFLTRMYQKFTDKRYERKRNRQYKKYLDRKESDISSKIDEQVGILKDNYVTLDRCQEIILNRENSLWQRRITDSDFLTLPVGIGDLPMDVHINYPEEHFSLDNDNLLEMVHELGGRKRILQDVPITYSFYKNKATGIIGNYLYTKRLADSILLQMFTNYSYDELKIATFTSESHEKSWDYLKALPHSWNNERSFRFFGSNSDDYREMVYSLEKIYQERKIGERGLSNYPHYVIVTDVIQSIDSYDLIKNIMADGESYGFSIIILVSKISALPNECKNFMEVSSGVCNIFRSELNSEVQSFKLDTSPINRIYDCAVTLANIPLDLKMSEAETNLPDSYQFLEMYQVGKIEQLNSLERWKKNNPVLSLQAPVGVGKNGEIIYLDLHEKFHGPHGLIAGTTGSGKSEFIINYVLSMAVNYHPNEVQMILIDYKGGSLAGAFVNDKYKLPHIAGTITNLDGNELNRSLASIESEISRRQREFNNAKSVANESTMDIYKYQKLYREGKLKQMKPISHLLIISDEFAELKEQQPEFMDKLISIARVGRSLGIHLILATQKPGGVVNAQIWSNTRFRVCLKVQDTGDSQEVLKKPDAAYLTKTGRFFLQVGYDEIYTLGQSAWAGGQYYPSTTFKKEVDTSLNAINNNAYIINTIDSEVEEKLVSQGEELPNIVNYISALAESQKIEVNKLWLDKIPSKIYTDVLKKKYSFARNYFDINPIIGEYDDPSTQTQHLLTVPMSKNGNVLVYGIPGSGKEQFIQTLLFSAMTSYSVDEINFYIVDFGAETLKVFEGNPYVGDVVLLQEEEKFKNLMKMLEEELNSRKKLFSNYGGTYQSYIRSKAGYMPNIVVIINNYDNFSENYDEYTELLSQLSREAYKYGIFFLITAVSTSSVRSRVSQNFALNYVLQQNDDTDYSNILGNVRGKIPSHIKGRGLFRKGNIYEFQTASIVKDDDAISDYIKKYNEFIKQKVNKHAKRIPILPEVVDYKYIESEVNGSTNVVVGVNQARLNIEKINVFKKIGMVISGFEIEEFESFIRAFGNELCEIKNTDFMFLNSSESDFSNEVFKDKIYDRQFDVIVSKLSQYVENVYNVYENNNKRLESINGYKKMVCLIYGLSDFIGRLKDDSKKVWGELFKKNNDIELVHFIFVDDPDSIKKYAFEEWFKNSTDLTRGIWLGNGIVEQMLIKVSKYSREDREDMEGDFGFIIQSSKVSRIKLLTDYRKNG